jgi:hypothetical protein
MSTAVDTAEAETMRPLLGVSSGLTARLRGGSSGGSGEDYCDKIGFGTAGKGTFRMVVSRM